MKRTVTPEETKKLFEFCHKHYVYQYDLQVELVDHLASAIEERWRTNPDLSFASALHDSFGKFGIYGFGKIKKQKQKELKRKYNHLLWKYFAAFYRWPKILMTLALTLMLFMLFQLTEKSMIIIYAYFLLLVIFAVTYFIRWHQRLKIKTQRKFMLLEYLRGVLSGLLILFIQIPNLLFQLILHTSGSTINIENRFALLGISLTLVASGILIYGQSIYIPKKIKDHFFEQFGEFAL